MDERNDQYIHQQRLFDIEDFKPEFVRGLKCFGKILILAAAYTQQGAAKLKTYLSGALELSPEFIVVEGAPLNDSECFLEKAEGISRASKTALRALLTDEERIGSLFEVTDKAAYSKSLKQLDRANLLVRPNSVTKKGLKIFTLTPRNKNIPPLFRETKEHE